MRQILFFLLISGSALSQSWMRLPDFPATKRDDGIGVAVNGNAYFGTGLQEWNATIDFGVLNLSTLTWTSMPAMPNTTERQYACGFVGTNCFFIFGGTVQGGALNTLFKYDILLSKWTEKSPKPGKGLIGAAAVQNVDRVVISNGKHEDNSLNNEVWEYNTTTDVWKQLKPFPFAPVWRSSYAAVSGKGYLLFGIDSTGKLRDELVSYDFTSDTWSVLDSFPGGGRAYAAMQGYQDRLYMFGGMNATQPYLNDFWCFFIPTKTWHRLPDLPGIGRRGGMSCAWNNSFNYSCGISEEGRLTETWQTDLPTSLTELSKRDLSVSPNPFKDYLQFTEQTDTFEKAQIVSMNGSILFDESITGEKLKLPELPAGLYLLKVETHSGLILTKKIIRE